MSNAFSIPHRHLMHYWYKKIGLVFVYLCCWIFISFCCLPFQLIVNKARFFFLQPACPVSSIQVLFFKWWNLTSNISKCPHQLTQMSSQSQSNSGKLVVIRNIIGPKNWSVSLPQAVAISLSRPYLLCSFQSVLMMNPMSWHPARVDIPQN